jgi:hypothetical protein
MHGHFFGVFDERELALPRQSNLKELNGPAFDADGNASRPANGLDLATIDPSSFACPIRS